MRRLAAAIGVLILAGCGQGEGMAAGMIVSGASLVPGPTVRLSIQNQGSEPVRVLAASACQQHSYNEESHDFVLGPAESAHFTFLDVQRLRVDAWRSSDSLEIFSETWDSGAFVLDDQLTVVVTP